KKGRIKREMFAKLRTNRYMKASGNDSAAVVEFTGKVQRIARVHQLGLKDKPSPKSAAVEYPQRQLLGFDDDSIQLIEKELLIFLSKNK
ncbi:phage virion morphogenesis protein, partial [Klebsiella pneumoniae]